jgi:hypothetical protein
LNELSDGVVGVGGKDPPVDIVGESLLIALLIGRKIPDPGVVVVNKLLLSKGIHTSAQSLLPSSSYP